MAEPQNIHAWKTTMKMKKSGHKMHDLEQASQDNVEDKIYTTINVILGLSAVLTALREVRGSRYTASLFPGASRKHC